MIKFTKRAMLAAAASLPLMAGSAWAEGLISIIVTDPANPYWFTEGEVAKATAEELGYEATVAAHKGDTNTESNLIDAAITNGAKALDTDQLTATAGGRTHGKLRCWGRHREDHRDTAAEAERHAHQL